MDSDKTAVLGEENEPLTEEDIIETILSEPDDEILDDLRGDNPPTCKACGVAYIDHLGHEGLCRKLTLARGTLAEIAFSTGMSAGYFSAIAKATLELTR